MAAITIGDIAIVYSGGASNTSQQSSVGGAISTSGSGKVISQTTTGGSLVTGVTINDAMGNAEGLGTLKWDSASGQLLWKPFGGVVFNGLNISASGNYTIGASNGYLYVTVNFGALPSGTTQDTVTVANAANKMFDNISALESLNGDTEYRCFYVKNTHSTDAAYDVRLWIKSQPTGSDQLHLALDPNGKNAQARGPLSTEEDATNVLNGIVFTQPSTYNGGLQLGNLGPGEYAAFWVKRVVPANTTTQTLNDLSAFSIAALI